MADTKTLDLMTVDASLTTIYPVKLKAMCICRGKRKIGDVLGLNNFGVNLVTLKPGAASAQRHWLSHSDEFVCILEGKVTLITDVGEEVLSAGKVAGFPANEADGHHLVNKTEADVLYLEIGNRPPKDGVDYPDIDMLLRDGKFVH